MYKYAKSCSATGRKYKYVLNNNSRVKTLRYMQKPKIEKVNCNYTYTVLKMYISQ